MGTKVIIGKLDMNKQGFPFLQIRQTRFTIDLCTDITFQRYEIGIDDGLLFVWEGVEHFNFIFLVVPPGMGFFFKYWPY